MPFLTHVKILVGPAQLEFGRKMSLNIGQVMFFEYIRWNYVTCEILDTDSKMKRVAKIRIGTCKAVFCLIAVLIHENYKT